MKPKEKEVGMEKSSSNCIDLNCSAGSFRDPFLNAPQSFPPRSIRVKTLNTPPLNLKPFSSCIGSFSIENFSTNIIIRSQIVIHYFHSKIFHDEIFISALLPNFNIIASLRHFKQFLNAIEFTGTLEGKTRTSFLVRGERYISIHFTRSPHEELGRVVISTSP